MVTNDSGPVIGKQTGYLNELTVLIYNLKYCCGVTYLPLPTQQLEGHAPVTLLLVLFKLICLTPG